MSLLLVSHIQRYVLGVEPGATFVGLFALANYAVADLAMPNVTEDIGCHLFHTECTAEDVTLTINNDCRLDRFPYLHDDLEGLFAWGTPLTGAETDHISNILTNLTTNAQRCDFYNSNGSITFGFDECGQQNSNTNDNGTVVTSYVHHWYAPGDSFPVSSMSQMTFQCNFTAIRIHTQDDDIEDAEFGVDTGFVDQSAVIEQFGLSLKVGRDDSGSFNEIAENEKIVIGEKVRVQLQTIDTDDFQFELFNCKAGSGFELFDVYDEQCPNPRSTFYGVERVDGQDFNIFAFRVRDRTTIKFDCEVRIYGADEELAECDGGRRRRRSAQIKIPAEVKKAKGKQF